MATGGCNANKITDELQHVEKWAKNNNLQLNRNKTKIMIIRKNHTRGAQPPLLPNSIETVDSLKILGVTLQCDLSFSDHINNILIESNRIIYSINLTNAIMVPNSLSFRRFSELESCLAFCMHPPLGGDIYLRRTELESTLF